MTGWNLVGMTSWSSHLCLAHHTRITFQNKQRHIFPVLIMKEFARCVRIGYSVSASSYACSRLLWSDIVRCRSKSVADWYSDQIIISRLFIFAVTS